MDEGGISNPLFRRQIVYTLRFMTHAEYSQDRWKETL